MPRKRRQQSPTGIYHWIIRGMNRKNIFHQKMDFEAFEDLLVACMVKYQIEIFHYCYMSNHVHLLIHAPDLESLSGFSYYLQRLYAYYYCRKYKWNGSVFQRRYKTEVIDKEKYLLECGRYIERNPVKAKMVKTPDQYYYSSYRYYAEGEKSRFLTSSPAYFALSHDEKSRREKYKRFVSRVRIQEEMADRGIFANDI